ncbi:hypothetical protein EHM69_06455 [candidate division KSB1 bacterium]|nr:MAG: hypothetical protein EHM69_06455 [candidate division KSB1 bacterium]
MLFFGWPRLTTGTENQEYAICFADSLNGWTTSVAGWIRRTTNGGATWTLQTSGTDEWLRDILFLNPDLGWAVGPSVVTLHYTERCRQSPTRLKFGLPIVVMF